MQLAEPEVLDETTITYVFGVRPTDDEMEEGVYYGFREDELKVYNGTGVERILVNFCGFLILQHLIPGLKAHVLYELVNAAGRGIWPVVRGPLSNVDYGPIRRTWDIFIQWARMADLDNGTGCINDLELERQWLRLLTQEDKSDEEILEEAWMGKGNMWIFKHPGIFPVAEAVGLVEKRPRSLQGNFDGNRFGVLNTSPLLALPIELMEAVVYYLPPEDVLHFIFTTKAIYHRFHPHLDRLTYVWIEQERPWYMPVGPIPCSEGDVELNRWEDAWAERLTNSSGGEEEEEEETPWFAYHLACKRSPNMKSRERIWKVVLQSKELLAYTSLVSPLP